MSSRHHRRKAFFEQHAHTWDVMCAHDDEKLEEIFEVLILNFGDRVLDVGTGTGIAIPYILKKIGTFGSVYAIDYAENMIMKAEEKFPKKEYPNVNFIIGDFFDLDAGKNFDSIICYSCFPHFEDKEKFIQKCFDVLDRDGTLLIAHSSSRTRINEMHARKHEAVQDDFLPSAQEIAMIAKRNGFVVAAERDDEKLFYILIKKRNE
jgi:demethylmenaquinone methyltransferase/2-methoxy-6-polyprenyl-1,4-benzoquinol methylase